MKKKTAKKRHRPDRTYVTNRSDGSYLTKLIYAFLDVTDSMKPHDYFAHMGGMQERADEVAALRAETFEVFGDEWLASKS